MRPHGGHGGHAWHGSGRVQYDCRPCGGGFGFYPLADHAFLVMIASPSGPHFPFVVIALLLGLG